MHKNKTSIILLALLSSSCFANAKQQDINEQSRHVNTLSYQLEFSENKADIDNLSDELEIEANKISRFLIHDFNYRAIKSLVTLHSNPNYTKRNPEYAKALIESNYHKQDYMYAMILLSPLGDQNNIIYDETLYQKLIDICSKHNPSCVKASSKREVNVSSNVATDEQKETIEQKLRLIETKPSPSHDDVYYYMNAINNGYHGNKEKLESMLWDLSYSLDQETLYTLKQIYALGVLFKTDDLKKAEIDYLIANYLKSKSSQEYQSSISIFNSLGDRGSSARRKLDNELLKNGHSPISYLN